MVYLVKFNSKEIENEQRIEINILSQQPDWWHQIKAVLDKANNYKKNANLQNNTLIPSSKTSDVIEKTEVPIDAAQSEDSEKEMEEAIFCLATLKNERIKRQREPSQEEIPNKISKTEKKTDHIATSKLHK